MTNNKIKKKPIYTSKIENLIILKTNGFKRNEPNYVRIVLAGNNQYRVDLPRPHIFSFKFFKRIFLIYNKVSFFKLFSNSVMLSI